MALVTVLPRVLPIMVFSQAKYPRFLVVWLKYVPVAIISAMLGPELLLKNNRFDVSFANLFFWVAIPTFIVAIKTKNLLATILTGMGSLAVIRLFIHF